MGLNNRIALVGLFLFFSLPAWAQQPVHGINNFRQVDTHVFRGSQPDQDGFAYLAGIGVKTILDLREADERSAWEEKLVKGLGMNYVNVAMTGLEPPTSDQISKILSLLEDATTGAVFVHCKRGADRTGAVIAAYRIDHDHWDNSRALSEARSDGMSFFQWPRQNFIRNFQPHVEEAKSNEATSEAKSATVPAPAPASALPSTAPSH